MNIQPLLAVLAATVAGCALPQVSAPTLPTLLRATRDPAQYRSALPRDVRRPADGGSQASGEACRTLLTWPINPPTPFLGSAAAASLLPWPSFDVTWGNDGYALAAKKALESAGGGTLVDVRADLHTVAVLGIWRRECVEVHALVTR